MTLLEEIADMENLETAFRACLSGKRRKLSPQLAFLRLDSYLIRLQHQILSGESYPWAPYREFYISDPKRRKISSAPFIDRVAHRAIYNVLHPVMDGRLIPTTYACRDGLGNGRAIHALLRTLRGMDEFWIVKLDVAKYFASIHHGRLMGKIFGYLPDDSAAGLVRGLLKSHPAYAGGVGLPLGNLTSQIFANFYLTELDEALSELLPGRYFRYMDDLVLVGRSREEALAARKLALQIGRREKLRFPMRKRLWLGRNGPVPFLGFLVARDGITPLNRNRRRVAWKLRIKRKRGFAPSRLERARLSYEAWMNYPKRNDIFGG